MSTLIRPELSETNRYWIEKHRYYELKHFCLQYPLWRHAYNSLIDYPCSWPQLVPPCKTNVVSDSCTLYRIEERGLAVIQQRFDSETKSTWWSEVDPWITDALYLHPDFREYFEMRAGTCTDGLYPTVTVRQIMWALKMKPIQKERWETVFDRRDI